MGEWLEGTWKCGSFANDVYVRDKAIGGQINRR